MKRYITQFVLFAALALAPAGVKAQCGDATLPYSMDFSGLTAGGASFVPCWTRVDSCQSGSAVYPNINDLSASPNASQAMIAHGNVLNFNGNSASGSGTMRAATPRIPAPMNQLELSFVVYKNTLTLYAASDPHNLSTYHLIGSYSPGYVWTTYEVRTDTVAGITADTGYLVFTAGFGSGYGHDNPYLDDLTIVALNSCPRPDQVTVEQVTNSGAMLSWSDVAGAQGYRVRYDTVDNPQTANELTTTATTATLTDLAPNRLYYVWVQTVCAPGSYSDARNAQFTTQLDCYPPLNLMQVSVGFDAASFAWEIDPRGNSATGMWTVLRDLDDPDEVVEEMSTGETSHIVSGLDPTHSYEIDFYTLCDDDTAAVATLPVVLKVCGESQLAALAHDYDMHPVPAGYNYGYTQMMYPADVFLDMDTITGIALHRYLLGSGPSSVTRTLSIWMHSTTDTSHNSAVSTSGMTQVANDVSYTFPVQEWDTIYFTTPFVYTPGTNVIVTIDDNTGTHVSTGSAQWMWHEQGWKTLYKNHDSSNPNPASVTGVTNSQRCPDMHFVGSCNADLSCVAPVVVVLSVDSNNAEIDWVGSGIGTYSLEYRTAGAASWTQLGAVSSTPYTLSNLQPATHYEVRVGLQCSGDETIRYSDIVGFTTSCAIMYLPFHFTQTDMCASADNGFTDCWAFSQYIYRGRLTNSHRGYLRNVAANGEWIMLPAIADDLSEARLRMWVASSDHGYVKVGIASQPNASDVVWLDTVEIPASQPDFSNDEYTVYLDNYTGNGNRVVLSPMANNDFHSIYFFAFHVEPIEDCRPVENLTLTSSTANSLSISWTPMGSSSQWAVYLNGTQHTVVNGQPSCTLTGLNPYTMYEVSVRSLCDDGDSSALVSQHFRTECAGEQCSFTIAAHASSGEGWKGAHLYVYAGSEMIENFTMLQGSDLSRSYSICGDRHFLLTWYPGNAPTECSFAIINASGDTIYALSEGPLVSDTLYMANNLCADNPCADRYVTLTKEECDSYQWHGETLTVDGTYIDTVTGVVTGGCDSIYTLILTLHESYSTTIDTTVEGSFTWHGVTYSHSGTYTWSGTTQYGCDSTEVLYLTIPGTESIGGLEVQTLELYPNPTSGVVKIVAEDIMMVEVYDATGRKVMVVRDSDTVDLSRLATGNYTLRVTLPEGTAVRRVVKN